MNRTETAGQTAGHTATSRSDPDQEPAFRAEHTSGWKHKIRVLAGGLLAGLVAALTMTFVMVVARFTGCVRFQFEQRGPRTSLVCSRLRFELIRESQMACPHCTATTTTELAKRTQLGYRNFRCSACRRQFNERTATPFNYLEFPTDIVLLVVLWRLRYKLSLRDLAEMFLERGFEFTHEAVRDWEARFAPLVAATLRAKRKGQSGRSWHVDETYIRVGGRWKYLYRAINREGNLVDSMLSEHRNMEAAKHFFTAALDVAEQTPEKVTTDGHDSYPRAIRETLGNEVLHRCNPYLNNRLEQDHRGIKQRYYPMRGFAQWAPAFDAASRFCRAFDEQRQYFRLRPGMGQPLPPLSEQRREHCARWQALMSELMAA